MFSFVLLLLLIKRKFMKLYTAHTENKRNDI